MQTSPIGPARLPEFIDLARRLCRDDPRRVPPLRQVLEVELGGGGAFARRGTLQAFLCEEGGRLLGRVAALIHPRLLDVGGAPVGQVGYFECADDEAAAGSLLGAAMGWLRARGCRAAWGPMNGGAHRAHRLMTRGHEGAPFLFEPRNPPYYPRLFEAHGFRPLHRWSSFELDRASVRPVLGVLARGARGAEARGLCIDALDPRRGGEVIARLHRILDRVWAGHVGYVPLEADEFAEVFAGVLALMTERNIGVVVDAEGRDLGCGFTYPDRAAEARALDGDAAGWAAVAAGPRPRRVVYHTVAFLPEARRTQAPFLLMERGLRYMVEDGYEEFLVALVTEELGLFHRVAQPTRDYVLYERELT
ncbi:MAG: hypothetical protein HY722_11965 [Planctomycetes bacterium]|nr:hypothetical protein [Planctomycetota bacterium]